MKVHRPEALHRSFNLSQGYHAFMSQVNEGEVEEEYLPT